MYNLSCYNHNLCGRHLHVMKMIAYVGISFFCVDGTCICVDDFACFCVDGANFMVMVHVLWW